MAVSAAACTKHKPPPMSLVAIGPSSACAQVERGAPVCWGFNEHGELGDGTTENRRLPVLARSTGRTPFVAMAVGERHACGVHPSGEVACWGDNRDGQLGTGDRESRSVPWAVAISGRKTIAAGAAHTCALGPDDVRCWGRNDEGQLGDGTRASATSPIVPTVTKGRRTTHVALGDGHTCFAFDAPVREVLCVGRDGHGEAGGGAPILRGAEVTALAAGHDHSCAALADGTVRCWGAGAAGQLGDGGFRDAAAPVVVGGVGEVLDVRAGAAHTCVRHRANTVSCWGKNDRHQLADGTTEPSPRAKPMFGIVGAIGLAAGGDASCVLLTGGFVRCWGDNVMGQLGDGTTVEHDVPMPLKWR